MRTPSLKVIFSIAIALLPPVARSADDDLATRLVAFARTVAPNDYSYTRTVRSEEVAQDKSEPHVVMEQFDPAKPGDQRWTFVSIDGRAPTAKEMSDYRSSLAKRRPAYYGRVAGYFASPATRSTDAQGRTLFHFAAMPKDEWLPSGNSAGVRSSDGMTSYFLNYSGARSGVVVSLRLADGAVREVLRFDEAARPHSNASNGIAEYGGWLYFTLSDLQSDIWVAKVAGLSK